MKIIKTLAALGASLVISPALSWGIPFSQPYAAYADTGYASERVSDITDDVSDTEKTSLAPGQMRISLIDYETGAFIDLDYNRYHHFWAEATYNDSEDPEPKVDMFVLENNPMIIDDIGNYIDADRFDFYMSGEELPTGCYLPDNSGGDFGYFNGRSYPRDRISFTRNDNGSAEAVIKLNYIPTGDVNNDRAFNISDIIQLEKWLLSDPDTVLARPNAIDYSRDGKINVIDLCISKRELLEKNSYVAPDRNVKYGIAFRVIEDELKFYSGPDESYDVIAAIPKGSFLAEKGYKSNNNYWMFTEYNGKKGWIRVYKEDNKTSTVEYFAEADKPVIYLYPEQETDVHVELELTEAELSTTYPKYDNGWDVTAYPDGTILNKADGSHHRYLFWDAVNCRTRFELSNGFCVAGSDTERFLKEKLTYMGLTEDEMNEFIVYWLPRMEHNAYNLISFQKDAYTNSAKLSITPEPDSMLRIFMAYVPLEKAVDIEPQQLDTFERKGFSVVEWGGSEIRSYS